MALEPTFSICFKNNCKELLLQDNTGTYSATNTGGWGAPNIELSDVDDAEIVISTTDTSIGGTEDVTTTVQAATIIDGVFELITLEPADIDSDETKFPDGIYTITYTITANGTDYEYSVKCYSDCQVSCCIEKMKTKFKEKLCTCDGETYIMNYFKAEALLMGLKAAACASDDTEFSNILASIEKICTVLNCNC